MVSVVGTLFPFCSLSVRLAVNQAISMKGDIKMDGHIVISHAIEDQKRFHFLKKETGRLSLYIDNRQRNSVELS